MYDSKLAINRCSKTTMFRKSASHPRRLTEHLSIGTFEYCKYHLAKTPEWFSVYTPARAALSIIRVEIEKHTGSRSPRCLRSFLTVAVVLSIKTYRFFIYILYFNCKNIHYCRCSNACLKRIIP